MRRQTRKKPDSFQIPLRIEDCTSEYDRGYFDEWHDLPCLTYFNEDETLYLMGRNSARLDIRVVSELI